jgi:hypothetical protein
VKAAIYLYKECSFTFRNRKSDLKLPQAETSMFNEDWEQIYDGTRMSEKPTERFMKRLSVLFMLTRRGPTVPPHKN